jgi:pilus assembly protein Flp/PilA
MNKLTTHLSAKAQSFVNSRIARDETGATAVEYGLIVGLIAAVIIVAVTLLGTQINTMFGHITTGLTGH